MRRIIEVVYEDGVFKPLEPVELEEGELIEIRVAKIEPNLQKVKDILSRLDSLPRRVVDLKLAEELYHAGKCSD